uniref:RxLR effector protein n=1 Tax=Phytophthora agathidicida TaxID=1642459 RepID=A0A7G4WI62_9STRA|nr:PaRXLR73 [Phytophthora agathidicida]
MRLQYVVALAATALVASVEAASLTTAASARGLTVANTNASAKRLLRTEATTDEDGEERASNLSTIEKLKTMSGVQSIKNLFTSNSKVTPSMLFKWERQGKSLDYVFNKLKLDKAGDNAFATPEFTTWIQYSRATIKSMDPYKAMYSQLFLQYGDDGIMKMAEVAIKSKSNEAIAKTFQKIKFEEWKGFSVNANGAFTALKLDKNVDDVLTNPNLNVWVKYADEVAEGNPKLKTSLIDTLRDHYNDSDLLRVFIAAKKNPKTEKLGANLEQALLTKYRANKSKNANARSKP